MKLNRGQDEAIKHGNGPCMVLAPPGSGKTLIVTERTRYLIEESGVRPDQILVITFTGYTSIFLIRAILIFLLFFLVSIYTRFISTRT